MYSETEKNKIKAKREELDSIQLKDITVKDLRIILNKIRELGETEANPERKLRKDLENEALA